MQILTPSGYVDVSTLQVGDDVIGFDFSTNSQVTNKVEGITLMDEQWFIEQGETYEYFLVNGTKEIFYYQSIFKDVSGVPTCVHGFMLSVGDSYYDENGALVAITSIVSQITPISWYKLDIDGNHSYIGDDIVYHNASRYFVGGGSSQNWNATANTNWGTASGVQDNASVPTSVDDVIFDGAGVAGNSNSTISATITILSLNITTGYTSTMTHNAVLTIAGNLTYTGGYTRAGASGVTINATSTITSNGVTWTLPLTFSNTNTKTLSGNLSVSGLMTISGITTLNRTTTETLTLSGGITVNASLTGTADLYLSGGIWSGGAQAIGTNLFFNGNVTISGNVYYSTKTITYTSGTITTTGSTLNIGSSCTANTNGITWNNVSLSGTTTVTLTSNFTTSGLLTIGGNVTFNKSVAETITTSGGITTNFNLSGTADLYLTGGTWSGSGGATSINFYINGNATISGTVSYAGNLTYLSGTITTTGSTLSIFGNSTLNTSGVTWNNITSTSSAKTITLTSNLSIGGLLTISGTTTINRTTAETVTCAGGITLSATLQGTAEVIITGGTWSGASAAIDTNLTFNGNSTVSGVVNYTSKTIKYTSGTITTTGSTLEFNGNATIDTNGITWNNVRTTTVAARTLTLVSDLNIGGLLSTSSGGATYNTSTGAKLLCAGGLTASSTLSGTAKVIFTGGTWSGNNRVANDVDVNGNITISGSVIFGGSTFNYLSGTVTTTGSTFVCQPATTAFSMSFNSNGITWNNFNVNTGLNSIFFTLTSDLNINGTFGVSSNGGTINKTTTEKITANGYSNLAYSISSTSTAPLYLTGGTWSGSLNLETYLNGNVTLGSNAAMGSKTLTYLSGVITQTSDFSFAGQPATLDTSGMVWGNITMPSSGGFPSVQLLSDLNVNGVLNLSTYSSTWNTSVGAKVYANGGLINIASQSGTAEFYVRGGLLTGTGNLFNNLYIDGNVTLRDLNIQLSATNQILQYINGNVKSINSQLRTNASVRILGFNKIPLKAVTITATNVITLDQPFIGREEQICQVSSTGANYTIAFTDTFEKIARNVAISGATLSRPMQLLLATNPKFATNRGTNVGLRYENNLPNGFAKNVFPIWDRSLTGIQGGLESDPCFQRQG